jgi:hypothetical protein
MSQLKYCSICDKETPHSKIEINVPKDRKLIFKLPDSILRCTGDDKHNKVFMELLFNIQKSNKQSKLVSHFILPKSKTNST